MLRKLIRTFGAGLIGAFIGYITNYIAIRMLFYPKRKIMGFMGLLPKFKENFADRLADFVLQFIDYNDVIEEVIEKNYARQMLDNIQLGFWKSLLAETVLQSLEDHFNDPAIKKIISQQLKAMTPKAKLLFIKRVVDSDTDQLAAMILKYSSKEVQMIQRIGAILGFVIGILEAIIFRH